MIAHLCRSSCYMNDVTPPLLLLLVSINVDHTGTASSLLSSSSSSPVRSIGCATQDKPHLDPFRASINCRLISALLSQYPGWDCSERPTQNKTQFEFDIIVSTTRNLLFFGPKLCHVVRRSAIIRIREGLSL